MDDLPNTWVRLVHALHCNFASSRIRVDYLKSYFARLDEEVKELEFAHNTLIQEFQDALTKVAANEKRLKECHDGFESMVATFCSTRNLKQTGQSVERLSHELAISVERAVTVSNGRFGKLPTQIERLDSVVRNISAKNRHIQQTISRVGLNRLSVNAISRAFKEVRNGLQQVKAIASVNPNVPVDTREQLDAEFEAILKKCNSITNKLLSKSSMQT